MKPIAILSLLGLLILGCQKEIDTSFLITQNRVGKLEKGSLIRELDIIFDQDSLVRDTTRLNFGSHTQKIKVFEKNGQHLITISPSSDSIPKVENVRIFDPRYHSEEGIGLKSNFSDIKSNYEISKVVSSMKNVVVFLKNNPMYFTIDKDQLPSNLRYSANQKIEEVQIPDEAKIKYFMVGWE